MNILEIELQTDDLTKTEIFYTEVLGLRITNRGTNFVSFSAGSSTLTFVESTNLNPKYHFAFNIPNNQLEESMTWASSRLELLKKENTEIIAHFESWNAKAIYFYDNNDNILEFIARFDLDNSSEKPFDISSIESISEIGIVTDEPITLAEKLINDNHLFYFEKGARSEKFASLGDDHGLFIIVETNRKWFPTDHLAEKHSARVKISVDGNISEIFVKDK